MAIISNISAPSTLSPGSTATATVTVQSVASYEQCDIAVTQGTTTLGQKFASLTDGNNSVSVSFTAPSVPGNYTICGVARNCEVINP